MQENFTYSLHKMLWLMDAIADLLLKREYGISFRKFYVLAVLSSCEPTIQSNLAQILGQSEAAVSRSLGVLEADGYVVLKVNPQRKRQNIVSLTPAGAKLTAEASAFLEQRLAEVLRQTDVNVEAYTAATLAINQSLEEFAEQIDAPESGSDTPTQLTQ